MGLRWIPTGRAWLIAGLGLPLAVWLDDGTLRNASLMPGKEWLYDLSALIEHPVAKALVLASIVGFTVGAMRYSAERGLVVAVVAVYTIGRGAENIFNATILGGSDKVEAFSLLGEVGRLSVFFGPVAVWCAWHHLRQWLKRPTDEPSELWIGDFKLAGRTNLPSGKHRSPSSSQVFKVVLLLVAAPIIFAAGSVAAGFLLAKSVLLSIGTLLATAVATALVLSPVGGFEAARRGVRSAASHGLLRFKRSDREFAVTRPRLNDPELWDIWDAWPPENAYPPEWDSASELLVEPLSGRVFFVDGIEPPKPTFSQIREVTAAPHGLDARPLTLAERFELQGPWPLAYSVILCSVAFVPSLLDLAGPVSLGLAAFLLLFPLTELSGRARRRPDLQSARFESRGSGVWVVEPFDVPWSSGGVPALWRRLNGHDGTTTALSNLQGLTKRHSLSPRDILVFIAISLVVALQVLPHLQVVMDDATLRNASTVLGKPWLFAFNEWLVDPFWAAIGLICWIAFLVLSCLMASVRGFAIAAISVFLACRLGERIFVATALARYDKAPQFELSFELFLALYFLTPLVAALATHAWRRRREMRASP